MKTNRLSRASLLLTLLMGSTWSIAEPLLNGLAVSTELSKERFIAALYSDVLSSDASTILNSSGDRRMELKVTDSRLSSRSLNSMWIEGMAINNQSSQLEAQAENLAKLTNMIRKRLVEGDTLRLDAVQGKGTLVSLNGIELGIIESDDFFPMILRTWIGSVPLSSEFKADLLANGNVDGSLASRYRGIAPDQSRIDAVAAWAVPSVPDPTVASSTAIKPPAPTLAVAAPPPAPTISTPAVEKPKVDPVAKPAAAVAATAAAPKPEEPKPAAPKPAAPKPEQTIALAPAAAPAANELEEDEDDEEEIVMSASSLLERQFYVSESLTAIRQNVSYPRRALEREQEGSIRLAVTVARNGDVLNIQALEEARHSLLNRAATQAVEKTEFPPMPPGVTGDSITYTAPIAFTLQ